MMALVVTICGLVILLAFEIRHREAADRLIILEEDVHKLGQETQKIKEELKKKKNVYEEYKPPSL
jgi:hypothetical protein